MGKILKLCVIFIRLALVVEGGNDNEKSKEIEPLSSINIGKNVCDCMAERDPICASDGKTYGNACELNCARRFEKPFLLGLCHGECPCCKEPYENEPIDFVLESQYPPPTPRWNISKVALGLPPSPENSQTPDLNNYRCTTEYDPICATNGKTYSNECQFRGALNGDPDLKIACRQECPCDKCVCECPEEPV